MESKCRSLRAEKHGWCTFNITCFYNSGEPVAQLEVNRKEAHRRRRASGVVSRGVADVRERDQSIDFPFLRNSFILVAHEELYGPDSQREEYVHPPPPNL